MGQNGSTVYALSHNVENKRIHPNHCWSAVPGVNHGETPLLQGAGILEQMSV